MSKEPPAVCKHPEWIRDCKKYWGEVLSGELSHWCYDWDELPVDETREEITSCTCWSREEKAPYEHLRERYHTPGWYSDKKEKSGDEQK